MAKKLRIGILFGGRSGEHEISLLSAASILKAIDRKKYEVVLMGITNQGHWLSGPEAQRLLSGRETLLSSLAGSAYEFEPASEPVSEADAEFAAAAAVLRSGEPLNIPSLPVHP